MVASADGGTTPDPCSMDAGVMDSGPKDTGVTDAAGDGG
jgi:hypothetical protein